VKAKLKIDTGSADALGLNRFFVNAENLIGPADKKIPAPGVAVGGYTKNYITRLKSVKVGNITIENPVIGYSEDTTRVGDAGTIGGEFFRRFKVIFDYSHQRIYLEKNAAFSDPYEYDMSGIFPIAVGLDLKVKQIQSVSENSPASDAGLKPDDIITLINDKPASDYSIAEIRQMFKTDGKSFRLQIERNGKPVQVDLKLRRLI
jgi:membrane-associated protease RseP (regulator of RpoE activity)